MKKPILIVMLTYNDKTVENAFEIFEQCKHSKAEYWGFKEIGLPLNQMKQLTRYMKECKKTTVLEVVAYTEQECMKGAQVAVECGFDILMGTLFYDSVNEFCKANHLRYMPFVGTVTERPSVLNGTISEIVEEAKEYLAKGVFGFDLLGYRYTGDAVALNKEFVKRIDAPVCLAGSVDSYERLDEVMDANPWAFTVGSAFFDHKFEGSFQEQSDKVYEYIKNK